MKIVLKFILIGLLLIIIIIAATYLYKLFNWTRIDIINIATLTTSIIAIIALWFNGAQYLLNKDKILHERGEFRLNNHYKTKIDRIPDLKFNIIINEKIPNKGRGFYFDSTSIHFLQHKLIEYLMNTYGNNISLMEIYTSQPVPKDPIREEFLTALKDFHDQINNYHPWINRYHNNYIDLIGEVKLDKKLSIDQKESFIAKTIQNNLLGYNLIINEKQSNNFNLINHLDIQSWNYNTIGYLDLIKPMLPEKEYYLKALGKYKYLMEEQLP